METNERVIQELISNKKELISDYEKQIKYLKLQLWLFFIVSVFMMGLSSYFLKLILS